MIEKQNNPQMNEKKVITKSIDYAFLNQLSTDFETRFVPQIELSAEQVFWSQYSVQTDEPNLSATTTIVEVSKELPKVSMVNSCLKKLKFHLANFDMVVKERTTATAITEGMWEFEHTKACFRDDIIPFLKALKELFTLFDQCLIDEVTEVQNVFKQMELAVEQHREEKNKFQNKMENVLQENDRLLTQELSVEIAQAKDTVILKLKEKLHSLNGDVNERNVKREFEEIETRNIELDHKVTKRVAENERLKQTYKQLYDSIKSSRVRSKEQCDDLINKVNLKSAEVSDLNASLQEKVLVITALKEQLNKLKGKAVLTEAVSLNPVDPKLLKVDVAPLVPKLHKNRTAHTNYIRNTQDEATILREIVESERLLSPLNTSLDYTCKYTRQIQELLMILQQICPSLSELRTKLVVVTPKNKTKQIRPTEQIIKLGKTTVTTPPLANLDSNTPVLSSTGVILVSSASGSMSQDNTKKNRIRRTQRKAKKNKIEDNLSVVDSKATSSVINSVSNVNFDLKCASCNGCLFSDNHDACVVAYIKSVNASRQFYESDLEVAFRQHTSFICNLDGVDLLTGSWGNNLYTLSLQDMMASSPICLLSNASKTKSWLWTMATTIEQQVALDEALVPSTKRCPFFKAFLVTADVQEIYMQEFWATPYVHQYSIRFKMDSKKNIVDLEIIRDMLNISPRVH
nr:integrase, catalytic region, zinc finger, CCHC-type, peptidase aspartic, catalytic [Tanacetum cinerariifolium]